MPRFGSGATAGASRVIRRCSINHGMSRDLDNFLGQKHPTLTRCFVHGAPSVKQMMELRPGSIAANRVKCMQGAGPGHWISIVMMTGRRYGKCPKHTESVTNLRRFKRGLG